MAPITRWLLRGVLTLVLAAALLVIGGAANAVANLPDLQPWHRLVSTLEPRAAEITPAFTLSTYLEREEAVFTEARHTVDDIVGAQADPLVPNRYVAASRGHPDRLASRWNRTQVLTAPEPRGGALLVHGLTDSPYSMRAIAERLHAAGYETVSLRMQGHGTVPGGLVNTSWEDWSAAVRMGARHLRERIGNGRPLVMVGYSNGGALVTKYALDALDRCVVAGTVEADPGVADDRCVAGGGSGGDHQPARSGDREGAMDRHRAGVQPVQVQLVSRQRGGADVADHDGHQSRDRGGRA